MIESAKARLLALEEEIHAIKRAIRARNFAELAALVPEAATDGLNEGRIVRNVDLAGSDVWQDINGNVAETTT